MADEIKETVEQVKENIEILIAKQKVKGLDWLIKYVVYPLLSFLIVATYNDIKDMKKEIAKISETIIVNTSNIDHLQQQELRLENKVYGLTSFEATKKDIITLADLITQK